MIIMGIEFAPLNVPLQRRLQTLAAASWFVLMAFGGFIGMGLTAYLVFFTRFWWLTLLYLLWALVIDKNVCDNGGRSSNWVRSWIWWKYFKDYFPLRLERLPWVQLDPKRNYLFCCFPHGILSMGAFNAFASNYGGFHDCFPDHSSSIVALAQHFSMPFFREIALAVGGISASAKAISNLLSHKGGGKVVVLMVGGAQESYYGRPGAFTLVLKNRKGFVKIALKTGAPLVPVLSFGENDLFTQLESPEGSLVRYIQEGIRKLIGFAPVVPIGRGFFQYTYGIIPQRRRVTTVVGTPIEVVKNENPSQEEVDELHSLFMTKLEEMFEEQKHVYLEDPEDKKLVIC